jgi:YHS domain-containing protein
MKASRYVLAALALAVAGFAYAADEKKEDKIDLKGVKCIVSDHDATAEGMIEFKGKKLFFCCEDCPKAFKEDPAKFMTKAAHQLLQTKQIAQVGCPISGAKVNPEKTVDVAGVKVAFCCEKCQGKAEKTEGAELLALVFSPEAFKKGFTLQNKCPVSGADIDASKVTEYKGQKVYFCCGNCPKAFEKDPAKFAAKLPQLETETK